VIPRTIKSFVIRQRTTNAQARAIDAFSERYVLSVQLLLATGATSLDLQSIYGNNNPLVLEIGFGMGDATWQIAKNNPDINYLAIDVHEAGVGALLLKIAEHGITNLRIMNYDAVEVLQKLITPKSLLGFHVFCPDPWPKRRHFKRRLLQAEFIAKLMQYLREDGYIHIITDHEDYKNFIEDAIKSNELRYDLYQNNPYNSRPETKFEQRALNNGGSIWDFVIYQNPGN
jgi:tRNA (guanine-N7-)-methyltransferase